MGKFTGVNEKVINRLKFQYADFIDHNFDLFETMYLAQIRLFNECFTGVPDNHIGSGIYAENRERFYNSLFDSYCYARLYPYYNGETNRDNIKIKLGRKLDRLTTSRKVKEYRDMRFFSFVKDCHRNLIGVEPQDNSEEGMAMEVSAKLKELAIGYIKSGKAHNYRKYKTEADRENFYNLHRKITLYKLENRAEKYKKIIVENEN